VNVSSLEEVNVSPLRARPHRRALWALALIGTAIGLAAPALAQEPSSSSEHVAITGGIDLANQYMFRGVRQNSSGIVVWPFADLTARVLSREGPLKRLEVDVGFWNSLHSGDTGSGGPIGKPWYEFRFFGTVALQFSRGVSVASMYTAYVSPSDMFSTVKELGIKLALDDRKARKAAIRPYALLAFEIDTLPGAGQLDGGTKAGKYLELGATPVYIRKRATLEFPAKVGLSLGNYYELASQDNSFGFVSVGSIVTVPLGRAWRVGRWNVHGGVEFQSLGETTKVFNGGDRSTVIWSFGLGLKP
jgi:hypothetical protein